MKVIIAGSRTITSKYVTMTAWRAFAKKHKGKISNIITGMAKHGADSHALWIADYYGIEPIKMPADWKGKGRGAGMIRNHEMGDIADALVAIWDGVSSGTKDMIDYAKKKGLIVEVYDQWARRRRDWE